MGTIDSIDVSIGAEASTADAGVVKDAPAVTSGVDEEGMAVYTYATRLNVANLKKPGLADYTRTETMLLIPSEDDTTKPSVTTAPADFVMSGDDLDYTVPQTTTTPAPAETSDSSADTTTTPPETTTTAAPETTTPAATTASPYSEDEDAEDIEDDIGEEEDTEPPEDDLDGEVTVVSSDSDTTTAAETTTASETAPSETTAEEPAAANNEIFTVNAAGKILTDTALNVVSAAVMAEISDVFDDEAIKAQAIATYTYIKYYNLNNQNAYIAKSTPTEKVRKLVAQVLGKALYYDGTLIQAVYTASTAGRTASSKNVWGIDYPYLRSIDTGFIDKEYDINYGRKVTFSSDKMKQYVENSTGIVLSGDPSEWIKIDSYVDEVFVGQMTIGGYSTYNNGTKNVNITGRVFREKIMDYDIRSSAFDIEYDASSDTFTITTYGYGHCVGFSQHGANILASKYGYTYDQILQFYYPGTTIA